ncbi:hypothetical protein D3C72_2119000 [compost metagenome]
MAAALLQQCLIGMCRPTASKASMQASNRANCSKVNAGSGPSASAKCVNKPSSTTKGEAAAACAAIPVTASAEGKPIRVIPVSYFK